MRQDTGRIVYVDVYGTCMLMMLLLLPMLLLPMLLAMMRLLLIRSRRDTTWI